MTKLNLAQIHEGLLNILIEVDKFCRENNIRYSIAYGTLLGAIRHKGFIPWDDDIDILMPRPDFERFVSTFGKNGGRYRCLYNTHEKDANFAHFFAKVHDTQTLSIEPRMKKYKFGLNIDIFPVDGKPDCKKEQIKHERKIAHYVHRLYLNQRPLFPPSLHDPLIPNIAAHLLPLNYWFNKIVSLLKKYDFETSKYCGAISVKYSGLIEIFERELFENYIELEFEGHKFMAFKDYDKFLKQQYNNYMEIPPKNKQHTHKLTVYEL